MNLEIDKGMIFMVRVEEIIHFELLKSESDYSGIVDLIASIKDCWTNEVNMLEVVKGTMAGYSLNQVLEIPLIKIA